MNYKNIYLVLLIVGAIVPYYFFVQFFMTEGLSLPVFVDGLFANGAAAGFSADIVISSLVFWIAIWEQHRRGKGPAPWLFIIVNLAVGLSMALPLYLFLLHSGAERRAAA